MRSRCLLAVLVALVVAVPEVRGDGNVVVTVTGDVLELEGDDAANQVLVTAGSTTDAFVVTGVMGTTVNGGSLATVAGVQRMTIRLGDGADQVDLQQITVPGKVAVRMDRGNDALVLDDAELNGRLDVRGGRGGDNVVVQGGRLRGRVLLRMGEGLDNVQMNGMILAGRLTVATGPGNDRVRLDDVRGAEFARVRIDTDSGDDLVRLDDGRIGDRAFVNMGDGNDDLWIETVTFDSEVEFTGGQGHDTLTLRGRPRYRLPGKVEFRRFERID